ncbi:MAG TPA: NADH-quinone oxidoreductase subunit C [Bacteroidales bacterium]|nr:NADH-quinone oxidoreductase subunit C [Bacteroidales bacterium]HRZ76375.1 NADH-quinone oxidoreductase subunit C [Bacteroidales bacterium]
MEREQLKEAIARLAPGLEFPENAQLTEVLAPTAGFRDLCKALRSDAALQFDYLISMTAVDYPDHIVLVYHLHSSALGHTLVLKQKLTDREKAEADTVSDLWLTAEYQEREVFDLFGVHFNGHQDMRRIFLEDHWVGHPLRKDYVDEINIIER